MGERATTDVFEGNSSDLICCRQCNWYTSRVEILKNKPKGTRNNKNKERPPYPDPAFYCDSYKRCKRAILIGAFDMAHKLKEMEIIDDVSQGPAHVSAIIGEW